MSWISNRAGVRPPEHRVETAQESLVRMRDGVRLRTVRISPRGRGIHPTILIRTPYNIGWRTRMPVTPLLARLFAGRGYHVVLQDTRGRYGSDGKFYPFVHERDDGLDTLDWISGQPFFDGNLGMWGPSYVGYTQWALADGAAPFLKALVPIITTTHLYELFYPNGAFSLISALRWAAGNGDRRAVRVRERRLPRAARARPMKDAVTAAGRRTAFFEHWTDHPEPDDYWSKINLPAARVANRTPVLSIAGTYDIFCGSQIADYHASPESTWLELGPYAHGRFAISPKKLGWKGFSNLHALASSLDFLDHHLQGRDLARPRVERYVVGTDQWLREQAWPPPEAREVHFFLRSRGRLDLEAPGATEVPDAYVHDPADPVPTRGGTFLGPRCGPDDQRPLEGRSDMICYDTEPLAAPLHIAGGVRVKLFAETDAPATDFCAKLVHLPADTRRPAINLCSGIERVQEARPGPMPIEIDLWSASFELAAGDRLRLEVASSNFPRYDAHPNERGNPAWATKMRIANQRIHHSPDSPSHLQVFVLG